MDQVPRSTVISEVYKEDFDRVQSRFVRLFFNTTQHIINHKVSLKNLKIFFSNVGMEIPLQCIDTITEVMRVVQQHSSFINCTYLEEMANYFDIPEAKMNIDGYQTFVEEFCKHTLASHSYMIPFLAEPSKHLSSETIVFKLEWSPDEKTLAGIQGLLRKTFMSLACRIHVVVVRGC